MAKSFTQLIEKFNPYHDRLGRFTSGGNASFMTIRTKDPSKQKWADMAIARAKEADKNKGGNDGGFAGQIASIKAENDKVVREVADLEKKDREYSDEIQRLAHEGLKLTGTIDRFEVDDKKYDKDIYNDKFDVDGRNKRIADIDAEAAKLDAEADLWYRDRPERGTPEYDEWKEYRRTHDINELNTRQLALSEEKVQLQREIRNYDKYKEHEAQRADYEKAKTRLDEINRERNSLVDKRISVQDQRAELSKQTEVIAKKAGALVADEIAKDTTASQKQAQIDKLTERQNALQERRSKAYEKLKAGQMTDDEYWEIAQNVLDEGGEINRQRIALQKEINASNATVLKNTLGQTRQMGIEGQDMKSHLPGRSTVKGSVEQAYDLYPTDWITKSTEAGPIKVTKNNRGYYTDATRGEMKISGSTEEKRFSTSIHELGHRMEEVVPGMLAAEQAFYNRRTQGEKVQRLKDVTGLNYGTDELTRKDNFLNPYMGKEYYGKAFELVSMGFQMAYTEPKTLAKDPDYQQFIYGLLAIY